jgi:hypothetical protein
MWGFAGHTYVEGLQVLQPKCPRIATCLSWYIGKRHIEENLAVPFFADHIRALTESFD